jgi:hypothetical protein
MNAPSPRGRGADALVGLLVGGAAGFLLIETVRAFFVHVLGRTFDVDGGGLVAVPVLCAALGAVIGARRGPRSRDDGG